MVGVAGKRWGAWVASWVAAAAWCAPPSGPAAAQPAAPHLRITGGSCPSAGQVAGQLLPLLPSDARVDATPSEAPAANEGGTRVRLENAGERYRIVLPGAVRALRDLRQDCTERARIAAVFIALNTPASQDAPPAPQAPSPRPWALGMRGALGVAAAPSVHSGAPALQLGLWAQQGALRLGVDAGALWPMSLSLRGTGPGEASVVRFPLGLGLSYAWHIGAWSLGPWAGLGADLLSMRGRQLGSGRAGLRLSPWGGLGLVTRVQLGSGLGVGLRLASLAHARRYALQVQPLGTVARTPRLWLQGHLGLDWRLR